jgi:signal transduction histidine kinase
VNSQKKPFEILIVDDVSTNIEMVAHILQQEGGGYRISFALDGASGLKMAQEKAYDLILLDVVMPALNGFEVCRRLKARPETADIPVIFITAKQDEESILAGFEAGAVDYVSKPFKAAELLVRVKTHLRLRASERRLLELNQSKDKFLSIISHDLRGPFGILRGLSQNLVHQFDEYSREELREQLRLLNHSAECFYKLLENLLTWSRVQRGTLAYRPTVIDLGGVAFESVFIAKSQAAQKEITLDNRIAQNILVFADREMVSTVFRNLLSNAIKFTARGGRISLSARPLEEFVQVTVDDNGIGLSQAQQEKLFRLDSQVKTRGTEGEEGSGLGLILCRELIEKNAGDIWLESAPQQGARFHFTLPAR